MAPPTPPGRSRVKTCGLVLLGLVGLVVLVVVSFPLYRGRVGRGLVGGDAVAVLVEPERLELLSIDPSARFDDARRASGVPLLLEGYPILGRIDVTARPEVAAALFDAIGEQTAAGIAAGCFEPRHALVGQRGGRAVVVLVCFECLQTEVFVDGKRTERTLCSERPRDDWNALLTGAGVPIAR